MDVSNQKPKVCSFCSLVCELPYDADDLDATQPWCIKRSRQGKLVPLRLANMARPTNRANRTIAIDTANAAGGQEDPIESGLRIAKQYLKRASSVLVTGRIHTVESARGAIELARRFDALIDPWDSDPASDAISAMQRGGGYSVSLGEARDRADLWIVVGDDSLLEQTPRLPSAIQRGESIPLLLLGRWSDTSIQRWKEAGFEVICIESDLCQLPKRLGQLTRVGQEHCESQVGRWLLEAKYTVVLYAPSALDVDCRDLWIEALDRWVLQRNETTRAVSLSWGTLQSSFHQTCTWLTGFPGRIRFQGGNPQYDPHGNRAKDWVTRQSACAESRSKSLVVWVDDSLEELPSELLELDLPKLIIGPNQGASEPATDPTTDLWLPAGIVGVTHTVHIFRGDQTVLAHVVCDSPRGSQMPSQWLKRLVP
jgi:formylmethanofuran dehydrogenase subunit B